MKTLNPSTLMSMLTSAVLPINQAYRRKLATVGTLELAEAIVPPSQM